uniref:Uncharacterized protein n=1 Tax=Tanacetum cinerariifolium TaxID=118510 RepID=A0A699L4W5_TANCI|nr:hypothetical protein [Tanacetum cinerariifolium]
MGVYGSVSVRRWCRVFPGDEGATVLGLGGKTCWDRWDQGSRFGLIAYLAPVASLLDFLRKMPVDPAFGADFQSCVDIVWFLTDF